MCGLNFGAVYGSLAEGFIHVHHVKPLSEISAEYEVDPIADLRPVCPNCHAVIHLGGQCRSTEEGRQLLAQTIHSLEEEANSPVLYSHEDCIACTNH
jgi:5-methylcytosine-specific restriction protein A